MRLNFVVFFLVAVTLKHRSFCPSSRKPRMFSRSLSLDELELYVFFPVLGDFWKVCGAL